ncbi:MAG: tetratricopeptide (TPR) repeat protein [Myxococcota bacterium]
MGIGTGCWIRSGLVGLGALLCFPADAARRGDESTLKSSNTLYELEITDGDASSGASAQAHISGLSGEVYFTLLNPIRPMEAVLFNDGTLLTADEADGIGRGIALALYEANGTCRWSHTLSELFGEEMLSDIPQNGSLYWWRQAPLEWRLEGEALLIALDETRWVKVQRSDGTPEIVTTSFNGPDPEMLVVRAHSAGSREARDLYSRALARDPSEIGGWLGLAELLQESGQNVAAINVLDQAVSTNQIPPEGSPERELYVQLFLEEARSRTTLGGLASSEGALSRAIEIAPDNQAANLALAALLLEDRRGPEADALLEDWIARGDTLSRLIIVGDFYAENNAWLSASQTYLQVWERTRDVMMGSRLVEAHRELGEYDEAIGVRRQQIRRWERAGGHEEFIAMAVDDIKLLLAEKAK